MSSTRSSSEFEVAPSREEAESLVKRMSAGASLSDQTIGDSAAKDARVLKIATFSLQKYLKVCLDGLLVSVRLALNGNG